MCVPQDVAGLNFVLMQLQVVPHYPHKHLFTVLWWNALRSLQKDKKKNCHVLCSNKSFSVYFSFLFLNKTLPVKAVRLHHYCMLRSTNLSCLHFLKWPLGVTKVRIRNRYKGVAQCGSYCVGVIRWLITTAVWPVIISLNHIFSFLLSGFWTK